jgi:glycosyltransferase involved in cell wall biosynthesis
MLSPIDWPEPFGLVVIEALACGTPVVARPRGGVPELMKDGVTGFFAEDVDGLAAAVRKVDTISRARCREEFEKRFTVDAMVDRYEKIYRDLIAKARSNGHSAVASSRNGRSSR